MWIMKETTGEKLGIPKINVKKKNAYGCCMNTFCLSSKVGLDLLCAAEKEVATRGLGVPTNREEELL